MVDDGLTYIFADWAAIVSANICADKGINVYIENPCDIINRVHVYGEILLHLPFVEKFKKFYLFYFPIILNVFFVYVIVSLFNQNNSAKKYLLIFFIFSLPVILVIERANSDIIVFLMMYLVSKYRNLFFVHIFIIFSTLVKFYPICFGGVFLFEKKVKKIFTNIIILILFLIIFITLQYKNLIEIFNNSSLFSGSKMYAFSINGLINALPNIEFSIKGLNINWLIDLILLCLFILPMVLLGKFIIKSNKTDNFLSSIFSHNTFENRLFIISSLVILLCYFFVQNVVYREIFLIGLIPWILKNENKMKNFFNFFFYLILIKVFTSTIFTFLIMNKYVIVLGFFMNLFKHIIDFYIVSTLLIIFFLNLKDLFKKYYIFRNI